MIYDGDVFDAFQAIVDGLEAVSGEYFLWGHPASRFELTISGDTYHEVHRLTAPSKLSMTSSNSKILSPSWSWIGGIGTTHCWVVNDRLKSEISDITYMFIEGVL